MEKKDKMNNTSDISLSKQEDNNISEKEEEEEEKEKLILPKINKELIPTQYNKMTNFEKYKKITNQDVFITSNRINREKINLFKSNDINKEDFLIYKLLKEKIDISPYKNNNKSSNKKKKFVISEESLAHNSFFRKRQKKFLKEMKVSRLVTMPNSCKKIKIKNENIKSGEGDFLYDDSESENKGNDANRGNNKNNKNNLNLKLYDKVFENNKYKKLKSLEKKNIVLKDEGYDYYPSNWRKHRNCALKYKYDKNKNSIDGVTSLLQNINNRIKGTFDVFKVETENIFDDVLKNKDKITF